jgi:hypothetical protein
MTDAVLVLAESLATLLCGEDESLSRDGGALGSSHF